MRERERNNQTWTWNKKCFLMKALGWLIAKYGSKISSKFEKSTQRVQAPHHSLPHHALTVSKLIYEKNNQWCTLLLVFIFFHFLNILLRQVPHFVMRRPSASVMPFKIKFWDNQRIVRQWMERCLFLYFPRNFTSRNLQKTFHFVSGNRVLSYGNNFFFLSPCQVKKRVI